MVLGAGRVGASRPQSAPQGVMAMEKAKILIIEEELIVREDLSISMREEGYEVVAAVTSVD